MSFLATSEQLLLMKMRQTVWSECWSSGSSLLSTKTLASTSFLLKVYLGQQSTSSKKGSKTCLGKACELQPARTSLRTFSLSELPGGVGLLSSSYLCAHRSDISRCTATSSCSGVGREAASKAAMLLSSWANWGLMVGTLWGPTQKARFCSTSSSS